MQRSPFVCSFEKCNYGTTYFITPNNRNPQSHSASQPASHHVCLLRKEMRRRGRWRKWFWIGTVKCKLGSETGYAKVINFPLLLHLWHRFRFYRMFIPWCNTCTKHTFIIPPPPIAAAAARSSPLEEEIHILPFWSAWSFRDHLHLLLLLVRIIMLHNYDFLFLNLLIISSLIPLSVRYFFSFFNGCLPRVQGLFFHTNPQRERGRYC